MRRWLAVMAMILIAAVSAPADSAFATHIGVSLFRYEQSYLTTGFTFLSELADQMELHLGADFGIATETTSDGSVQPSFLIPVTTGLNFTFPSEMVTFYVGVGMMPSFEITPGATDDLRFYLGPYARTGVRLKVHAVMSAFFDLEQDLLIGGPAWVNTSTRILGGIHFSFP